MLLLLLLVSCCCNGNAAGVMLLTRHRCLGAQWFQHAASASQRASTWCLPGCQCGQ